MARPFTQKFNHYFIYCITNKINGKQYVGFHTTNNLNDGYLGSGKAIHSAILKYGIDNFEKIILEECDPNNWAEREKYWIEKLETYNNGYNLTLGGEGSIGLVLSESSKQKISFSNKGKSPWNKNTHGLYSEEYRNKLSLSSSNRNITKETRDKISKSNTGKIRSEEVKIATSIRMSGISNTGAKKETQDKVSRSLKGKFAGENNPMSGISRSKDDLKKYKDQNIELKGDRWEYMRSKIRCTNLETNEIFIFDGVKELSKALCISKNKYYRSLNNPTILPKYKFDKI